MVAAQGHIHWTSPELKALAGQRGDPCAVGEAYRRHGDDCLRHMAGPFAIAVVDADCASGLLAVDRMGRHAMCYATPQDQLVFGSTAESVGSPSQGGVRVELAEMFNYSTATSFRAGYDLSVDLQASAWRVCYLSKRSCGQALLLAAQVQR